MKDLNQLGHDVRSAQAAADSIEENIYAAQKALKDHQEAAQAAIDSLNDDLQAARQAHQTAISELQTATDRVKAGDYGAEFAPDEAADPPEDDAPAFEGVNRTEAVELGGF